MKAQETFTIVAVFIVLFGLIAAVVIYQNTQKESSARIKYEYETLKSYLRLPENVLSKLVSGGRVTGSLGFVEGFEFEDRSLSLFKVRNNGDVPLTGFKITFNEFAVLPEIVPYILPPNFDSVIILKSRDIAGKGTIVISTDQGASLQITKPA